MNGASVSFFDLMAGFCFFLFFSYSSTYVSQLNSLNAIRRIIHINEFYRSFVEHFHLFYWWMERKSKIRKNKRSSLNIKQCASQRIEAVNDNLWCNICNWKLENSVKESIQEDSNISVYSCTCKLHWANPIGFETIPASELIQLPNTLCTSKKEQKLLNGCIFTLSKYFSFNSFHCHVSIKVDSGRWIRLIFFKDFICSAKVSRQKTIVCLFIGFNLQFILKFTIMPHAQSQRSISSAFVSPNQNSLGAAL